jgi:hypothetical protein
VVINATGDPYDRVSIVSVDPIGDTITFSQTVRGVTTQTTLNVSPAAVILIAGQPATLAQLVAGEQVTLETDPMDAGSVTSIVGPPQHEGHGRGGRR